MRKRISVWESWHLPWKTSIVLLELLLSYVCGERVLGAFVYLIHFSRYSTLHCNRRKKNISDMGNGLTFKPPWGLNIALWINFFFIYKKKKNYTSTCLKTEKSTGFKRLQLFVNRLVFIFYFVLQIKASENIAFLWNIKLGTLHVLFKNMLQE